MRVAVLLIALLVPALGRAESVSALIERGDALDAKNQNAAALAIYLQADAAQPNDAEILRRIAKQYSQQMVGESKSDENRALGEKALDYAKRAKALDPKNANARLCLAICYGKVAFLESARTRVEFSRLIKDEADAAVGLDPSLDYGWHVLGRWNYELANFNAALRFLAQVIYGRFPDASNERAVECFRKAIAINPDRVIHHVELGRTYAAMGRKEEARAELKKGLSLPSREKDDDESKDRARKALGAL
jgi:tetratricopeptide (TPR) repeat protein